MIERLERTRIMHRIVRANGTLYFGGLVADDVSQDMAGQTRQICAKLDALLAQAGSSRDRMVSAQIFVTKLEMKEAMNEVWTSWLAPEHLPARATVGVASLGSPETLIEIVVTALA